MTKQSRIVYRVLGVLNEGWRSPARISYDKTVVNESTTPAYVL